MRKAQGWCPGYAGPLQHKALLSSLSAVAGGLGNDIAHMDSTSAGVSLLHSKMAPFPEGSKARHSQESPRLSPDSCVPLENLEGFRRPFNQPSGQPKHPIPGNPGLTSSASCSLSPLWELSPRAGSSLPSHWEALHRGCVIRF